MADDIQPFTSAAALRQAHTELLKAHRQHGDTPAVLDTIERGMARAEATGALIDSDEERWACQALLDYWTATLFRSGRRPSEHVLAPFDPMLAPELDESQTPYVGLSAFDERTARLFFGRERLVDDLRERVRTQPFTAVVGPSGSGKSSFVLAGLVPALRQDTASGPWRIVTLLPGDDPLGALAAALVPPGDPPGPARERLAADPAASVALLGGPDGLPTVLVVDQFEEIFTLCADPGTRGAFVRALLAVAQDPSARHRVVVTMRSDFENHVALLPDFQPIFERAQFRVTPLGAPELRRAIEDPAALAGLKFEPGVVDRLVAEILGEPAGLPLLQFTLHQLWRHRERNRVTMRAYEQVGGGRMALARSADEFYAALLPEEQVTARRILLAMVRPGEGLEVTSNPVTRRTLLLIGEAPDRVARVLDKLIDARLVKVRVTPDAPSDDHGVEVAHEALVRNWPTLVGWIEDERARLRRRVRLRAAAEQWATHGKDPGGLLGGSLLDEAARYDDLSGLEQEFVAASRDAVTAQEREREALRERELSAARALAAEQGLRAEAEAGAARRLRRLVFALAALAVIAGLLAGSALLSLRALREANGRATERAEMAQTQTALARQTLEKLQVEVKRLQVAQTQAQQYKEGLSTLSAAIESYGNPAWTKAAAKVAPLTSHLRVRASAVPRREDPGKSRQRPTFDYSLWVDGPLDALARVASVRYEFNHPTFTDTVQESRDRANRFRVGYIGWGCLASVIVTLRPVDPHGEPSSVDFNMCAALSQ